MRNHLLGILYRIMPPTVHSVGFILFGRVIICVICHRCMDVSYYFGHMPSEEENEDLRKKYGCACRN